MNVYDLLMKFDIIQIYCLSLCSSPLCFQENSVIKAQLAFRHATERNHQSSYYHFYKEYNWPSLSPPPSRQHRNGKKVYLKYVRIFSAPTTSDRMSWPLLLTKMLTLSTTSRNTWRARHHHFLEVKIQDIINCCNFVCQWANKIHKTALHIIGSNMM
jgi:hypothetical protein